MIYLLRHGQTEYNVERRIQGRCDSPLTELGKEQARAMGTTLRELTEGVEGIEVIASPLARAATSAEIVREAMGLERPVIHDHRLQEVGCGSWEKHHFDTISARDPRVGAAPCFLAAWASYCTDGEQLDEAIARLSGWLSWAEGRNLVVVSHGVAGGLLRALYAGASRDRMLETRSVPQDRFHQLQRGQVEELACS